MADFFLIGEIIVLFKILISNTIELLDKLFEFIAEK